MKREKLPHPPMAYSQVTEAGELLFVAGQPGINFATGEIEDGFEAQARRAFDNVRVVLESAGAHLGNVVKTTVWLRDAQHFAALNELYAEYFPANAPARSTPLVALPRADMLISIEAIARKPRATG